MRWAVAGETLNRMVARRWVQPWSTIRLTSLALPGWVRVRYGGTRGFPGSSLLVVVHPQPLPGSSLT